MVASGVRMVVTDARVTGGAYRTCMIGSIIPGERERRRPLQPPLPVRNFRIVNSFFVNLIDFIYVLGEFR